MMKHQETDPGIVDVAREMMKAPGRPPPSNPSRAEMVEFVEAVAPWIPKLEAAIRRSGSLFPVSLAEIGRLVAAGVPGPDSSVQTLEDAVRRVPRPAPAASALGVERYMIDLDRCLQANGFRPSDQARDQLHQFLYPVLEEVEWIGDGRAYHSAFYDVIMAKYTAAVIRESTVARIRVPLN